MHWDTWLLFLLTEIVLSTSPGPAVLLVVSQSLRTGAWSGIWAAFGILTANVIWFALSAVGVGSAILAAGPWFIALKWLGAAYLVYLAWRAIATKEGTVDPLPIEPSPGNSARGSWLRGLVLQLTNPKALMFFVALLPQFIDPHRPAPPQVLILGMTSIAAELPILALYAALAARAATAVKDTRWKHALNLATAAMLLIAALSVLTSG
jgi:homoserine/homoserine lactone efflux protein